MTLYAKKTHYAKNFYEGKALRFLQIFNTVYAFIYLGLHLALTAAYQRTRCDFINGTLIKDSNCTDWASPFLKKGSEMNKFELDFNNLPTMIAFLMGFYVNMVVVRWWDQVHNSNCVTLS